MPSLSRPRRIGLVVATCALLVGCGLFGDPVQRKWDDREKYPSCGDVTLGMDEQMIDPVGDQADAVACLRQAHDLGEGAEVKGLLRDRRGRPDT